MDVRLRIIIMVVSVIVVVSVSAADLETEALLSGLENSEVSLFANTSGYVYHMETDKYKPGYVMYTDEAALKTSDGNNTETIAGHSTVRGYKEGVGEDARFNYIYGFTQISPTRVIVSDYHNHCLRHVDRVTRVTSVFAGQCESNGYQDGSSAKFYYPFAVIVDKKNSKQLLVTDRDNRAVRTVEIESKNVGTFIKSNQLDFTTDLVQDKITGDIYIANSKSLYKLSYNTKSLNMISYGSTGQINGKQPSTLLGLFKIETVILVADRNNDSRILKYDTVHDTWSTLNICDVTKTHKNTDKCVTKLPTSILLTSNRLLIGGNKITSYKPVCNSQNKTVYTDPQIGSARVELARGYNIILSAGSHTYETPGPLNETCTTTFNVIDYMTEALTTPNPPTNVCTDRNITVYTDTHTGTARVEIVEGLGYIDLPEGTHPYETLTAENMTCTTRYHVIDNSTNGQFDKLICPENQVALTSPENGRATFKLQFGDQDQILQLPLGQYHPIIETEDQICNFTLNAEDYRVRRTLELVADYSVDCSALTSTVTRSLLEDVAKQKYTIIEALCGSACKKPGNSIQPKLTCNAVDGLQIRWPTDLVFTAKVMSVPSDIRHELESRIRARGATLDVVVFGSTPPIVYPRKAANGGYVSIALTTTCINGLVYSDKEKKCV